MDDVRHQTAVAPNTNGVETNGKKAVNGTAGNGVVVVGDGEERANLALPDSVVEEALRVARESLEMVCEIEGEGGT